MLGIFYTNILDMSIKASIVIVVVIIFRAFLNRMPKLISYCLWSVVLFRLLCPVTLSIPSTVAPDLPSVSDYYIQTMQPSLDDNVLNSENGPQSSNTNAPAPESNKPTLLNRSVNFGINVWLIGIAIMVTVSLFRYLNLRISLKEAVLLREHIYQADRIDTPFVIGLFQPKIYIPSQLTEEELPYILRHEQYHITRKDHIIKALFYGALCLHWFNPLVWIAFRLFILDMEMSCDEAVLRDEAPAVRASYSTLLLQFSVKNIKNTFFPLAFSESDTTKRIHNLKNWRKHGLWLTVSVAVLAFFVIVLCGTDRYNINTECIIDEEYVDRNTKIEFQMKEFPGVQFVCTAQHVTAEKDGHQRKLISSMSIHSLYLSDLNGDGKRELCATSIVGSGIADQRILVYDYADGLCYDLNERFYANYALGMDNNKLTVTRCYSDGIPIYYSDAPVELDQGHLILKNRQLFYISETTSISGQRATVQINMDTLSALFDDAIGRIETSNAAACIYDTDAMKHFIHRHQDLLTGINDINKYDNHLSFAYEEMQSDPLFFQYLLILSDLNSPSYQEFVYYDSAVPDRLFICTELHDTRYDDIQSYYNSLCSGKTVPHPDTYIITLDDFGIYTWESSKNLYNEIVN